MDEDAPRPPSVEPQSQWQHLKTHDELISRLTGLDLSSLRCLRMMGTFIGAAGDAVPQTDGDGSSSQGLVEQMATTLSGSWDQVQSVLLLGSGNRAVPMNQAPYQYYTYLFVSRLVDRLLKKLHERAESRTDGRLEPPVDQLAIRFTFVPEDILFAQFFFDDQHLVIAASYSWNTLTELRKLGAYAAVYMDNTKPPAGDGGPASSLPFEPRFPNTSQRLVQIFDARFREQSETLGQEVWILKRLNERDYGVLVETPFWRETKSVLRAFEFGRFGEPQVIELGTNGLKRFKRQIESQIGPNPTAR